MMRTGAKLAAILAIVLAVICLNAKGRVVSVNPDPQVVHNGVLYVAPSDDDGMGRALDVNTRKSLWQKRIYEVVIYPELEADVQWIYPTAMFLDKAENKLIIVNGRGTVFALDLASRDVVALEPGKRVETRIEKKLDDGKEVTELVFLRDGKVLKTFSNR